MTTAWLITLVALAVLTGILVLAARYDRGWHTPPRSHVRDSRFRSPMSSCDRHDPVTS